MCWRKRSRGSRSDRCFPRRVINAQIAASFRGAGRRLRDVVSAQERPGAAGALDNRAHGRPLWDPGSPPPTNAAAALLPPTSVNKCAVLHFDKREFGARAFAYSASRLHRGATTAPCSKGLAPNSLPPSWRRRCRCAPHQLASRLRPAAVALPGADGASSSAADQSARRVPWPACGLHPSWRGLAHAQIRPSRRAPSASAGRSWCPPRRPSANGGAALGECLNDVEQVGWAISQSVS